MNPLRIISPDFQLLGEIDDYESFIFTSRFFSVGDFELHININKKHTDKLIEDNLIMLGSNIYKVGVIRHSEINQENEEELIIKGYTLKGVIGRRITVPPINQGYDRISGNAETVMKHYVDTNCINPADTNRKIPQVINALNLNRGISTPWQTRFEKLDDVCEQIGAWCNMGWNVYLDIQNQKWVFDVMLGRDVTADQSALPPVIFSLDFDNIKSQHYINSALSYKNVGYAGGKGEEENRLIQQIGVASGLERIETFLDCSNATDADELISNGQQALNEYKKIKSYEGQIINTTFIYEEDWKLGDIVTIQNKKWGLTMNSRIIEVKEVYEPSGYQIEAVFGNSIPTLLDAIKQVPIEIVR